MSTSEAVPAPAPAKKKLTFNPETLRRLTNDELSQVGGAMAGGPPSPFPACNTASEIIALGCLTMGCTPGCIISVRIPCFNPTPIITRTRTISIPSIIFTPQTESQMGGPCYAGAPHTAPQPQQANG